MEDKALMEEAKRLFIQGKHAESVEAFTRALEKGADPFMAFLSRGVARLQMKEAAKAIEDFTRAAEAQPENFRSYYYRGTARMVGEDLKGAVEDYTKAIRLNPDHGASFFARGTCLTNLGLDEEAAKDLKTAISLSEAAVQGFVDTYGILRTQFDSVLSLISGERRHPHLDLTDEETEKLRKWLEEG
ncbi:MAG: hypothetical protein Kow0025_03860 [Thermodesulfovibrionales bacterium]